MTEARKAVSTVWDGLSEEVKKLVIKAVRRMGLLRVNWGDPFRVTGGS